MARRYTKRRACPSAKNIDNRCVCKSRRLTVREGYHSYQLKQPVSERSPIPLIELKGHWLHQAGFTHQTPIRIKVMRGCLVVLVEN